ncbi:MAG TPA: type II secretion system F family protein [Dehalococcoidia bacterium]|nr:type II secretion system F family protein [Dehalococcoidia bacterium]
MDILALAAAFAVMGAIVAGLVALYQSTASPRNNLERRLGRLMGDPTGMEATAADFEALRSHRTTKLPFLGALLEGRSWNEELSLDLERGDIKLTPSEFIALRFFFVLAGAAIPLLMVGTSMVGVAAILLAALIGFQIPKFYLNFAKGRRLGKLNDQLPEMLSMLANSLKAGFGLMQSLDLVSREMTHPIATEIHRVLTDINVGSTTEEALSGMARRAGSGDLDIVVTAMLVQQSTGGNLAEILENVAHTMRERIRIRGEIKTLTTQQMMTGYIIGGLPIFVGLAVSLINPEYMNILFTELAGQVMLGGAFLMECFGIFLIKRILAIEV